MDFNLLLEAFGTVMLNPMNFFFVFIGITSGIIVGALQVIIGNPGSKVMDMVQPDIAGKPLDHFRKFIV